MTELSCTIPEHVWLVLEVDDYMDQVDPMGITAGRDRPHEYFPELPDFIDMIVTDTVTTERIDAVFEKFFGHPLGPFAEVTTENLVNGLTHIRSEWIAYRERTGSGDGV